MKICYKLSDSSCEKSVGPKYKLGINFIQNYFLKIFNNDYMLCIPILRKIARIKH